MLYAMKATLDVLLLGENGIKIKLPITLIFNSLSVPLKFILCHQAEQDIYLRECEYQIFLSKK